MSDMFTEELDESQKVLQLLHGEIARKFLLLQEFVQDTFALSRLVVHHRIEHTLDETTQVLVIQFSQHLERLIEDSETQIFIEILQKELTKGELLQEHIPQFGVQDMRPYLLVECATFERLLVQVRHAFL